eukprot:543749_1
MEPHCKRQTVDINTNNDDFNTPHDDLSGSHPTATDSVQSPSPLYLTITSSNPKHNSDISLQSDDALQNTLHGMSSLISIQSDVTITHIPQDEVDEDDEHVESLESDNSESDSVSSGAMHNANASHQVLQKIETHYPIDIDVTESTLRVNSSRRLPSTSVETQAQLQESDSDDYTLRRQHTMSDRDLNEKCNEIRNGFTHNYIQFKWRKLIQNRLFYNRIPTCIVAMLLLFVSVTYCIGQTCHTQLDLVTKCPIRKTREQIWKHSGEVQLRKYQSKTQITRETQWGWSDDACYTTKRSEINTYALWHSNKYKYEWVDNPFNTKTILFALTSIYCVVIIAYGVGETVRDIVDVKNNTLHKQSYLYRHQHASGGNQGKVKAESMWLNYFRTIRAWYKKYLSNDTSAWIVLMFIGEVIEISVQCQALLLYNGYNVFDPSNERDVYLASKPHLIRIFAAILAFNIFGSGLCWLFYVLCAKKCRGLGFKLSLFYVDQLSDFLYTIFPFIMIFGDPYTQKASNKLVWIAQLNIDSNLGFVAAFVPLFFLCNKCLIISINLVHKLRDDHYHQWSFIQSILSQTNTKLIAYQAQLRGFKNQKSFNLQLNQKEIYDHNANIKLNVRSLTHRGTNKRSWINADNKRHVMRTVCIVIMSLFYFVLGIQILIYTETYLNQAEEYCYQIDENRYFDAHGTFKYNQTLSDDERQFLVRNSELLLWDKCLYQVYPFVDPDHEEYKCQCRVFVMDWQYDLSSNANDRHQYLNITQPQLLTSALQHWYMMEKFSTQGAESSISVSVEFKPEMLRARKLRAFSWISLSVVGIDEAMSIKSWSHLEYFRIENTNFIRSLPYDFDELHSLKYFRSTFGGLTHFPPQLCALTSLRVIQIEWAPITTIPHCVVDLSNLELFHINGATKLAQFPVSLLSLPKLEEMSLWKASFLTFENLLTFNNVTNTSKASLEQYFDDNFKWNENTNYYLSLTPLCDDSFRNELPTKLQQFLNQRIDNDTLTCTYPCVEHNAHGSVRVMTTNQFCPPHVLGDGKCDFGCNEDSCSWDLGDCNQLCFNSAFSNCTLELLSNTVCDPECNNMYCKSGSGGKAFSSAGTHADNGYCAVNQSTWIVQDSQWEATCQAGRFQNIYTTEHLCLLDWAGDGFCDDSCRTDLCLNDKGDCDTVCVDDACNWILNAWNAVVNGRNNVYLLSEQDMCDFWPIAKVVFGMDDSLNCTMITGNADIDLNNDAHINFREFVILALRIYEGSGIGSVEYDISLIRKLQQINCSTCIGMEHYDVVYVQ